jgi:hypothetical protein
MASEKIERLYNIFSRYRCPRQLEGCPCCTSTDETKPLIHKSLRAIAAPELEHYASKALTTWGSLDDYKYFIPRILELTDDGSLLCDTEITLGKFAYGNFRDWPADEQQAIHDFITSAWQDGVRTADLYHADAILCGAAPLLDDVSPLLDYADAFAPEFRFAYAAEHSNQTKRKLLNSFWDDSAPNYQRVLSWLYPNTTNVV